MREENTCCNCTSPICKDEVAITKRLINRGATEYYCTACLADAFGVTAEDIRQSIRRYKMMGCTLFM